MGFFSSIAHKARRRVRRTVGRSTATRPRTRLRPTSRSVPPARRAAERTAPPASTAAAERAATAERRRQDAADAAARKREERAEQDRQKQAATRRKGQEAKADRAERFAERLNEQFKKAEYSHAHKGKPDEDALGRMAEQVEKAYDLAARYRDEVGNPGRARVLRNVAAGYRDKRGLFHPFRAASDYNEFLAGDLFPRSRKVADEQLSLSQFVRRYHGIKPDRDGVNFGEWRMLKEAGRGLASTGPRAKSAGRMSEAAAEAGYPVEYDSPAFISQVIDDAAGYRKIWSHAKDWGNFEDDRPNPARGGAAPRRAPTPGYVVQARLKSTGRWARLGFVPAGGPQQAIATAQKAVKANEGATALGLFDSWKAAKGNPSEAFTSAAVGGAAGTAAGIITSALIKAVEKASGRPRAARPAPAHGRRKAQRKPNPSTAFKSLASGFLGRNTEPSRQAIGPAGTPDHTLDLPLYELVIDGRVYDFDERRAVLGIDGRGKLHVLNVTFARPAGLKPGQRGVIGYLDAVVYGAKKEHLEDGKYHPWRHQMGEEGGRKPKVTVDYYGFIRIEGGDYKIRPEGIRN